jgi:hypothetical protein
MALGGGGLQRPAELPYRRSAEGPSGPARQLAGGGPFGRDPTPGPFGGGLSWVTGFDPEG